MSDIAHAYRLERPIEALELQIESKSEPGVWRTLAHEDELEAGSFCNSWENLHRIAASFHDSAAGVVDMRVVAVIPFDARMAELGKTFTFDIEAASAD